MALQPADRYASANALAQDVEHWLADEPVSARRDPLPARAARWARKHPATTAGGAAVGLMLLVGLAIGLSVVSAYHRELHAAKVDVDAANERLASQNATLE